MPPLMNMMGGPERTQRPGDCDGLRELTERVGQCASLVRARHQQVQHPEGPRYSEGVNGGLPVLGVS